MSTQAQSQQSGSATSTGDDVESLEELYHLCKDLPRSERVEIVFNYEPTSYQAELLDHLEQTDEGQAAPQKGRQVGATLTAGVVGADHALWAPMLVGEPTDVLFTAPGQETADEMFQECKDHFKNGPLSLEQFGVTNPKKQTWEFASGTRILSRTLGNVGQDKNPGNRGMNPTCVVVDEAHYEQDAVYTQEVEQFFLTHPVYEYLLTSTPAGESGYFYEKVKNDDDFFSPYWPSKISPFISDDKIEDRRKKLPEADFKREILGEFEPDADSAIPYSTLKPNLCPDRELISLRSRFLGVDPARGGKDEMVAIDMDAKGTMWNAWAFDTISGPEFVEFLEVIQSGKSEGELEYLPEIPQPDVGDGRTPRSGYQTILIEENGVGGFAADFAEAGLGNVIKVVTTSNEVKQDVYQRFIQDLEAESLELPRHDPMERQITRLEKTFTPTQKAKYAAPPGKKDDWPDATAFANWARHGHGETLDVGGVEEPGGTWYSP